MSFLSRLLERWSRSDDDVDGDRLRRDLQVETTSMIGDIQNRSIATVAGSLKSLTVAPRGGAPTLVAELSDGTGVAQLVWLGRRAISGVDPGVFMQVTGRVTMLKGVPTMFNPQYCMVPRHGR